MKLKTNEIVRALEVVQPGLAKKDVVEQFTHFIFQGENLVTYNDKVCVSYPFKTDFECSVESGKFYKLISSLEDDEVDVRFDGRQLLVSSDKTRFGVTASIGGKIVKLIETLNLSSLDTRWKALPDNFVDGLFLCMFSASRDLSQGSLACLLVDNDRICSSDNFRISQYILNAKTMCRFLIPVLSVFDLVKFPVVEYVLDGSWIHFRTREGIVFSSRIVVGDFPEVEKFFNIRGTRFNFPLEFRKVVKDVSIMAEGEFDVDKVVEVSIKKGLITCRAEKRGEGWIEKDVSVQYEGKEFSFLINPIFLFEVLDKSTEMILSEDKALFRSGSFRHVMTLPMKQY